LLGYIAGAMASSDMAIHRWLDGDLPSIEIIVPGFGIHFNTVGLIAAALVVCIGKATMKRRKRIKV
jgi:hypothetical protein